ncbi:cytoskeletal protein RodZ [Microbacteriaceae bacterium SG_E_30_P1]|uniref:Cytoskeletal protein RodZ n=1 Tax=Antiquaquibacter oligotrophicus TaxID=2880260 RepID=A0ABT6KQZ2_9MICO|nr:Ig-like domain-containing protein [Antiquaquibacter oligotrophicus]MDH6181622.1 cytoskeletal protein RodZ [Antiquaquibacter oligotrophicus]UDF12693.1 Ig-like domain-containing protein [Antiquaquibacter oligotrophicus]
MYKFRLATGVVVVAVAASLFLPGVTATAEDVPTSASDVVSSIDIAPVEPTEGAPTESSTDRAPDESSPQTESTAHVTPADDPADTPPTETAASVEPEPNTAEATVVDNADAVIAADATASVSPSETAPNAELSAGTRDLRFSVVDQSGAPVTGATVTPSHDQSGAQPHRAAVSDSSGVAHLADVPLGNYRFHVAAPSGRLDLAAMWWGDSATQAGARTAHVTSTSSPSFEVVLSSVPGIGVHIIDGTITNYYGQPLPFAEVELYRFGESQAMLAVISDENGRYSFSGLSEGYYQVHAAAGSAYLDGWWGGSTQATASLILVDASDPQASAPISLAQSQSVLRVTVYDPHGFPLAARVVLYEYDDDTPVATLDTVRGEAVFIGLNPSNAYKVWAEPLVDGYLIGEWSQNASERGHAQWVALNSYVETVVGMRLNYETTTAGDDHYFVEAGGLLSFLDKDLGVLRNDFGQPTLEATLEGGPTHAADFELLSDGTFVYGPEDGFVGDDTFTYRAVSDSGVESDIATVTITVWEDDTLAPDAIDDSFEAAFETLLVVDAPGVLANDIAGSALPIVRADLVADVQHGTLVLGDDGGFSYQPEPGFEGTDEFRYTNSDGEYGSWPATVTITVSGTQESNTGHGGTDEGETGTHGTPDATTNTSILAFTGGGPLSPALLGGLAAAAVTAGVVVIGRLRRRTSD